MNINVYLNSCSLAVDCTLGYSTMGYMVLTEQPAVFNTHCGTEFITPMNTGIHPFMPDPDPTATILSELVRTHKHEVCLFNEYCAFYCACKKVISKLIPKNSTTPFQAVSLASRRSQASKFLLTSSSSTLNLKKKTCKTSIGR